jgi:hypothetical protein
LVHDREVGLEAEVNIQPKVGRVYERRGKVRQVKRMMIWQ